MLPLLMTMDRFDLSAHQWKHRLLVVSGEAGDAKVKQVHREAKEAEEEFRSRDLLLIDIGQDASTRARLQLPEGFSVALIGKDGGVKLRRTEPIDSKELFGIIDAMPMRQEEMASRKPD
ncbi:DUF4174 domain-containing protein [bacterium]|nr:MAG: DUF4174 domain-containing protein [bacterium]